ncbi:hypothetical protein M431DRAFT_364730 [Trichoderma harzianum CBS 226.95]|uniref:Uncharacterized protein n=1 Tax=Trichoderma harzianum CBS 226.95 TaxID=983964 RepID=A0A2T3ZT67_TRIHA|nr:hypothetical protein M431DRAFT_364730 [Trichoderma harzianum CBS 226.95]PTB47996.1 hypothetical protein M431DRAFT_364730 [Trichoderma harzianum CBS 226.95]
MHGSSSLPILIILTAYLPSTHSLPLPFSLINSSSQKATIPEFHQPFKARYLKNKPSSLTRLSAPSLTRLIQGSLLPAGWRFFASEGGLDLSPRGYPGETIETRLTCGQAFRHVSIFIPFVLVLVQCTVLYVPSHHLHLHGPAFSMSATCIGLHLSCASPSQRCLAPRDTCLSADIKVTKV